MARLSFLLLIAAGAAGAKESAPPLPATPMVMQELRRIESAGFTGTFDAIRMDYSAKVRTNAADPMPRVFLAWLTLPSDGAWNQLKAVAQIFPDNPWVHYGMGRIYAQWKMRDQALAELGPLLKRDPAFYPALIVLGDLAAQQNDHLGAEGHYRQALALADDPLARTGLGLLLLKQGKRPEAAEQLKQSVALWPEQPAALTALVPLLAESKDPGLIDAASKVVALRPKDAAARRQLADLRFEAGDQAGAAKDYEQVLRLGSPDVPLLERLILLYRDQGDAAGEERMLLALASLDPTQVAANLRVAQLRLAAKDPAGAQAQFNEVLARAPGTIEARLGLATLQTDQGAPHLALEQYRAVKAADPSNETAVREVARLETAFKLPKRQIKGNVNGVYWAVGASLEKFYAERRAAKPALQGLLKLKLRVAASGAFDGLEVVDDTLKDPLLLGHAWFSLRDAQYWDKKKLEAVIEFTLGKKK